MDAQQCGGFRADGLVVIGEPGAIRRADFVQLDARLPEDIGQAKRAADLDELAARDDRRGVPAASVCKASNVAAAQLFTTSAASAPVTSWQRRSTAAPR